MRATPDLPCPVHDPLRRASRGAGDPCSCGERRHRKSSLRERDYERIYSVIEQIPKGRVATYGGIARLAGLPGHARQVGFALREVSGGRNLPWHRVVNAKGEISGRSDPRSEGVQRVRLQREGVVFAKGRIPLRRFQWDR